MVVGIDPGFTHIFGQRLATQSEPAQKIDGIFDMEVRELGPEPHSIHLLLQRLEIDLQGLEGSYQNAVLPQRCEPEGGVGRCESSGRLPLLAPRAELPHKPLFFFAVIFPLAK